MFIIQQFYPYNEQNSYNPPFPVLNPMQKSAEIKNARKIGMLCAAAILGFILFSSAFIVAIGAIITFLSVLGDKSFSLTSLLNSPYFTNAFEIIYSVLVVGGPFFVVGMIMRKSSIISDAGLTKPKKPALLPVVVLGGFGICMLGNIITSFFDSFFESVTGLGLEMPETVATPPNFLGITLALLSTAVAPALIEEIALRGVVMQSLRRYGDWFAILCSSMVFALLHCNLVQIPFAFIAGVAIGYAVTVTESLWTGILIHFFNNAFSVAVTIVYEQYGEGSAQYAFCDILFYVLTAVGLICAVITVKAFSLRLKRCSFICPSRFKSYPLPITMQRLTVSELFKAFALNIPMIIAYLAVIYETSVVLISTQ